MTTASIPSMILASLFLAPLAFAQTTLDESKTQDILKQLTSQPRKTWISAGTIEGTHQEYSAAKITDATEIDAMIAEAIRAYEQNSPKRELTPETQKMALEAIPFNTQYKYANTWTMTSREVVTYDGDRFHWEVTVTDRGDSVRPDADIAKNSSARYFNRDWNNQRVFAWDGQKYTTYSASANVAYVDAADSLPRYVHGPLTAGLIPWGHGKFSSESLADAEVSVSQNTGIKGEASVQMSITHSDGSTSELALDSSKAYAVTSATLTTVEGFAVTYTLSGYNLVAGQWVPSSVSIERKNLPIESMAPTSESWTNIRVTDAGMPSPSGFTVPLAMDSMVEYVSPATMSTAVYVNSYEVDADELLAQRLAYGIGEGSRRQNCATVALQHVASCFGKATSNAALAKLVDESGSTSLYDLKRFAQGLGLNARVVKTDLAGLRKIGTAKAILHIPGKNHFVVVDRVSGQDVWLIDLSSRNFYYRHNTHLFPIEWTAGTALLLSDQPIPGRFAEIPDAKLANIAGGAGWQCNNCFQETEHYPCDVVGGICMGMYTIYPERWSCGQAASGACLNNRRLIHMQETCCIPDPLYTCDLDGDWSVYYLYCCD